MRDGIEAGRQLRRDAARQDDSRPAARDGGLSERDGARRHPPQDARPPAVDLSAFAAQARRAVRSQHVAADLHELARCRVNEAQERNEGPVVIAALLPADDRRPLFHFPSRPTHVARELKARQASRSQGIDRAERAHRQQCTEARQHDGGFDQRWGSENGLRLAREIARRARRDIRPRDRARTGSRRGAADGAFRIALGCNASHLGLRRRC